MTSRIALFSTAIFAAALFIGSPSAHAQQVVGNCTFYEADGGAVTNKGSSVIFFCNPDGEFFNPQTFDVRDSVSDAWISGNSFLGENALVHQESVESNGFDIYLGIYSFRDRVQGPFSTVTFPYGFPIPAGSKYQIEYVVGNVPPAGFLPVMRRQSTQETLVSAKVTACSSNTPAVTTTYDPATVDIEWYEQVYTTVHVSKSGERCGRSLVPRPINTFKKAPQIVGGIKLIAK